MKIELNPDSFDTLSTRRRTYVARMSGIIKRSLTNLEEFKKALLSTMEVAPAHAYHLSEHLLKQTHLTEEFTETFFLLEEEYLTLLQKISENLENIDEVPETNMNTKTLEESHISNKKHSEE